MQSPRWNQTFPRLLLCFKHFNPHNDSPIREFQRELRIGGVGGLENRIFLNSNRKRWIAETKKWGDDTTKNQCSENREEHHRKPKRQTEKKLAESTSKQQFFSHPPPARLDTVVLPTKAPAEGKGGAFSPVL